MCWRVVRVVLALLAATLVFVLYDLFWLWVNS